MGQQLTWPVVILYYKFSMGWKLTWPTLKLPTITIGMGSRKSLWVPQ